MLRQVFRSRDQLRGVEYVRLAEEEMERLRRSPRRFRVSALGRSLRETLTLTRRLAIRHAGGLALLRFDREVDVLSVHLDSARELLARINARR
jgi:hypothetical protein